MCKAFSCLVDVGAKVTWKFGVDSHTDLVKLAGYKDLTADPAQMTFARVEITPDNGSYLAPDKWSLRVDESITPAWFAVKHQEAAFAAHKKWIAKLYKIVIHKEIVHPFELTTPPPEITKRHIRLLKQWASVWASVGASVWDSVRASVRASVWDSVGASVGASVWASVRASVRASVGASVWDSVWDSVRASVRASVWAYTGSFFILPKWKYVKHPRGKYPFAPAVKLWECGLVPSFDGKTWRLHGGKKAKVLFEISADELRGKAKGE